MVLCVAVFVTSLRAEITHIRGKLPGAEGYEVRLITAVDFITYSDSVIARARVDSTAGFHLETDILHTIPVMLDLDYYSANLVIEPGQTYYLDCDSINITAEYRPFYEKDDLVYQLIPEDTTELNYRISAFNIEYNRFITTNFVNIYQKRMKSLIDTFRTEINSIFLSDQNEYLKDYINFKFAQTELSAGSVKKEVLFKKYLDQQPVLYRNPEYMHFFNQFFNGYVTGESKAIRYGDLQRAVNELKSCDSLLVFVSYDSLFSSERIRELVTIKTLFELYRNPDFLPQNVIYLIRELSGRSVFAEHRIISRTMINVLTHLQYGTPAPDFRLPDLNGDLTSLKGFRGKPVYLGFLTTFTYACLAEFDLMADLYLRYGGKIHFVTVSLDKNIETIRNYANEKGFKWTFLYNGSAWDLIHDYGIKTFPLFVLIDADGNIFQYPAYKPSEIIEEVFQQIGN